jgi:hypothetical protein
MKDTIINRLYLNIAKVEEAARFSDYLALSESCCLCCTNITGGDPFCK